MVLWNHAELDDDDWYQLHQQAACEQKDEQEIGQSGYRTAAEEGLKLGLGMGLFRPGLGNRTE